MQHALARDLNTYTSSTYDTPSKPHYRSTNAFGFRVARATGEIFGEYISGPMMTRLDNLAPGLAKPAGNFTDHNHLTVMTPCSNVIYVDFGKASEPAGYDTHTLSAGSRGPKPKVRDNPLASIIKIAGAAREQWIDDAVMAGMYIGVGSHKGKLNISPRNVRMVIQLDQISVKAITEHGGFLNHNEEPYSERSCQYVAAAGRIAVSYIEHYLHQRPALKNRLEIAVTEQMIADAYEGQALDHIFSSYMPAM